VRVEHFFPTQEVLRDSDIGRLCKALSAHGKSRDVHRLADFRKVEVKRLFSLFDKTDAHNINDD